jgi:HK97 gp10 family phage protein
MKVTFNQSAGWGKVSSEFTKAIEQALADTGSEITQDAQDRCPVVTGMMRDSIYWVGPNWDGYDSAYMLVEETATDHGKRPWLIDERETVESLEVKVVVLAGYAEYVHDGTVKQGANPFLRNAVDDCEEVFTQRILGAIEEFG